MAEQIKSGKEILNDFFENINSIKGVDENIALKISELYQSNKLTDKNLSNALLDLREGGKNGKNQ